MKVAAEGRPPPGPIGVGGVDLVGDVFDPDPTAIASAWLEAAPALADWTLAIRSRDDAQGAHYEVRDENSGKLVVRRHVRYVGLDRPELIDHYRATTPAQVRGMHLANADEIGLFAVIDVDNHDDVPELVEINRAFALAVFEEARAAGLAALLFDGNGRGSYHVWILLGGPTSMRHAWRLCRWLIRGWAAAGLPKPPDIFPHRPRHNTEKRMGLWVWLPGRHHKRAVWTKVWDPARAAWAEGAAAVAAILATLPPPVDVAAAVPADFENDPKPAAVAQQPRKPPDEFAGGFELRGRIRLLGQALERIDDEIVDDYHGWVAVGMAIKGLGDDGFELWDRLSSRSGKYDRRALAASWASFRADDDPAWLTWPGNPGPVSPGTIFHMAREAGWVWPFTRVVSDLVLRSVSVRSHSPTGRSWPYRP